MSKTLILSCCLKSKFKKINKKKLFFSNGRMDGDLNHKSISIEVRMCRCAQECMEE